MNLEDRKKILSKYEHIFENEKKYYRNVVESSSGDYDLENESFFRKAYLKFREAIGNVNKRKILDVGCGGGALSFYLSRKGANVTGIDISASSIEACRKEAKTRGLTIDFREMNAQIPDFEDETFDMIVGSRVIHHLPNLDIFFKECKRLLKKDGYIVFIEPLKKNIIVELNRKFFAPEKRTHHEHPLYVSDIEVARKIFGNLEHWEYFLISPLAMFFRDFVKNKTLFTSFYKTLNFLESPLTKIRALKQYCWQTVIKCSKI